MTELCPCCGRPMPGKPRDPIGEMADRLREWCVEHSVLVLAGDRVSEADAARILGREPRTLQNWRSADAPLAFVKVRGRASYELRELARFLSD